MPISIIITGIFTGTLAALFALSQDSGVVWAFLSYAVTGALALIGAGLITTIRRNTWPRKGWQERLNRMTHQSDSTHAVDLFGSVKPDQQVRM